MGLINKVDMVCLSPADIKRTFETASSDGNFSEVKMRYTSATQLVEEITKSYCGK